MAFVAKGHNKAATKGGKGNSAFMGSMGGGKAPKGSSSKKGLDKSVPGIELSGLHKAGKTHPTFNAERLAGLKRSGK